MRAVKLKDYGEPLRVERVSEPDPTPSGVVVETIACGVCRSDWHAWQGDWGWVGARAPTDQILGHEPVGRITQIGADVDRLAVGDLVAVPFTLSDGSCAHCRRGRPNLCESLVPLGFSKEAPGAFAEYFPVPSAEQNAVKLPSGLDPVALAGLGCRFVTAFHGLYHRADVQAGQWVVVYGCGGVGLSAVHIADAMGARVIGVDIKDEKLEKAARLGAVETFNSRQEESVARAVRSVTGGGAAVSVDALGVAETCRNAVSSLARRGQHIQLGLTSADEGGDIPVPTDAMVMKEIEFVGSFGMPTPRYDQVFGLIESGDVDPGVVISEHIALEEVPETIAGMGEYETMGIPVVTEF